MPLLSIRDYLYLAAIAIIVGGLAWWHHAAVLEGEAKIEAAQARAIQAQAEKDAHTNQVATDALQAEVNRLRADSLQPVPVVRLCSNPRQMSAPTVTSRAQPAPASPGSVPEVSPGAPVGPDIGPGLQRLAIAADLVSARERALLERDEKL